MIVNDGHGGAGIGDCEEVLGAVFENDGEEHGFLLQGIFGVAGDGGEGFQQSVQRGRGRSGPGAAAAAGEEA
jgi:hypothetical protein